MRITETVASRQLIFGAEILIDLDVERILVIAARSTAVEELFPVRQRSSASRRKVFEYVQRRGIEARRRDDAARKWLPCIGHRVIRSRIEDLPVGARKVSGADVSIRNS